MSGFPNANPNPNRVAICGCFGGDRAVADSLNRTLTLPSLLTLTITLTLALAL